MILPTLRGFQRRVTQSHYAVFSYLISKRSRRMPILLMLTRFWRCTEIPREFWIQNMPNQSQHNLLSASLICYRVYAHYTLINTRARSGFWLVLININRGRHFWGDAERCFLRVRTCFCFLLNLTFSLKVLDKQRYDEGFNLVHFEISI